MVSTSITIQYSTIIDRCRQLSSFEGKNAVSGSGENLFDVVRLTEDEDELLKNLINDGLAIVEQDIGGALIWQIETDADAFTIEAKKVVAAMAKGKGSFERNLIEVLVAYTLERWLEDKIADRSAAYKQIFSDMFAALKRNVFRKREPDWEEEDD